MIETPAPKGFVTRGLLIRVALVWLVVAAMLLYREIGAVRLLRFYDPDDALRLIQVRDLLGGQGWFDLHQYRVDPPGGVPMHWSRLVDLPLALAILIARPFVGAVGAEQFAVTVVPLITLAAALFFAARLAWKLFSLEIALLTGMLWTVAIPTLVQLRPGRIDHHGWQIVAVLAALNALTARSPRRAGWLAGVALGFGMSISLELLPFAGLFAGVFALRWLGERNERDWLVSYLQALAVASCAFFAATRGFADLTTHCDSITPAYLAGLIAVALLVSIIPTRKMWPQATLVILLGGAALMTVAVFLALAPQCSTGPFAALDPLVKKYWYNSVIEGMPVWHLQLPTMVQFTLPPLLGLIAAVRLWGRAARDARPVLLELAIIMAGSLVVGIMVTRFGAVTCAIATIPLAAELRHLLGRMRQWSSPLAKVLAVIALIFALLPSVLVGMVEKQFGGQELMLKRAGGKKADDLIKSCGQPGSLAVLGKLPPATLFAPFDIGPTILLKTHHRVVATAHHRAAGAMHDVIAALLAPPDKARELVLRHRPDYVLTCSDLNQVKNFRRAAKGGLVDQLVLGHPPEWLEPVALPKEAGTLKLWRVVYPVGEARN